MRKIGTVKWFDSVKGYGFLVVDGLGDALLHRSALEAIGVTTVREGAVLDCEIVPKELRCRQVRQVYGVIDPDSTSEKRSPRLRDILVQEPTGPAIAAECKWFSRTKGYGFVIARGSSEEVFVHMDLLRRQGLQKLKPGQRVKVRVSRGPKGLIATAIEDISAGLRELPDRIHDAMRAPPNPGETTTNVVGELLMIDTAKGFGIVVLTEMADVAFVGIDLLRAAGATDPLNCGTLVCDVESAPPLFLIRRLSRFH